MYVCMTRTAVPVGTRGNATFCVRAAVYHPVSHANGDDMYEYQENAHGLFCANPITKKSGDVYTVAAPWYRTRSCQGAPPGFPYRSACVKDKTYRTPEHPPLKTDKLEEKKNGSGWISDLKMGAFYTSFSTTTREFQANLEHLSQPFLGVDFLSTYKVPRSPVIVKISKYIVLCVYRRSYLLWSPVRELPKAKVRIPPRCTRLRRSVRVLETRHGLAREL